MNHLVPRPCIGAILLGGLMALAGTAYPQTPASLSIESDAGHQTASKKKSRQELVQEAAAQRAEWDKRAPLVLVHESNPWTNSDGPTLALYPDGTLIYWSPAKHGGVFRTARLSQEHSEEFRVQQPAPPFDVSFDAARSLITVRRPGQPSKCFGLLGSLRGQRKFSPNFSPQLRAALEFLATYEHPQAVEWIPERIEVALWPAPESTRADLLWPSELPGLEAGIHDSSDGGYALRLTREQYALLQPLLESRAPGQAFHVGNRRWTVYVRYPFPHGGEFATFGHSETAKWKVFSNRAGWSINYPADWKVTSCKSCSDPTDPKVFVDFFPPAEKDSDEGWLIVEHLADSRPGMSADEWFAHIKRTNNLNPRIKEQRLTLNDLLALKVRYRNPSRGGQEIETVYVISGSQTLAISFSGNKPVALEALRNYPIYLKMLSTLRVNR